MRTAAILPTILLSFIYLSMMWTMLHRDFSPSTRTEVYWNNYGAYRRTSWTYPKNYGAEYPLLRNTFRESFDSQTRLFLSCNNLFYVVLVGVVLILDFFLFVLVIFQAVCRLLIGAITRRETDSETKLETENQMLFVLVLGFLCNHVFYKRYAYRLMRKRNRQYNGL